MLTAIFISSDRKFAGQCELWVRQGIGEKLRVEVYPSIEAYKQKLENPDDPAALAVAAVGSAPGASGDAKKTIRAFVIELELLGQKPVQTVIELQRLTKEKLPAAVAEAVPRVLVMAFEGGNQRLDQLQHDAIDDLILKPLDKSLFLQKLEFLIAESSKVTPNFLFRAKTAQIIEVGRDVMIDEISEFAIAIRSPGPVPEGAFASIHCDVFGTKGARRIIGRVYDSGKHPVREGEYIVRFAYFGITTEQLSTVRRFIHGNQTQVRTKVWGQAPAAGAKGGAAAAANARPGLSKELMEKMALLKSRKVAVIDMNLDTLNEAKSIFDGGFKGLVVRQYPSYTRLAADLSKMIAPEPPKAAPPAPEAPKPGAGAKDGKAIAIEQTFPNGKKLAVILRGKSHDLVRFEPELKKSDLVLGKTVQEWLEKPDQWQGMVDRDDRDGFEEFLGFVEAGTTGRANFRMSDATGRTVFFEAFGQLEKAGGADGTQLLKVEMTEMDHEGYSKSLASTYGASGVAPKDPNFFKFELVLIDAAMLRPTPAIWHENFVALLRKAKVLGPEEAPPKIVVMSDPRTRSNMDDFRIKGVSAYCAKPLDRRYLIQLTSAFCPQMVLMRDPESPPFVPCELHAKLGKEVTMDEVSEFGLSILHPTAFREKSHMRFFSRLFGDEGEWVAGRCLMCEKSGEGDNYRCHFLYFGPGEELLQRIRRWIREDHVAKKEKSGS